MFSDVDDAGDLGTRTSLSGMAVLWGVTLDRAWERGAKHHGAEQWRV